MTDAPIFLISISLIAGIAIGWQWGTRQLKSTLRQSLADRNESSLKLLESQQQVKKLDKHIDSLSGAKQIADNLQARLNSANVKVEQQSRSLEAQDKAHFIESAHLKLALIEAQMLSMPTTRQRPVKPLRTALNVAELCSSQGTHTRIRSSLKVAGIKELSQLAALTTNEIRKLGRDASAGQLK